MNQMKNESNEKWNNFHESKFITKFTSLNQMNQMKNETFSPNQMKNETNETNLLH